MEQLSQQAQDVWNTTLSRKEMSVEALIDLAASGLDSGRDGALRAVKESGILFSGTIDSESFSLMCDVLARENGPSRVSEWLQSADSRTSERGEATRNLTNRVWEDPLARAYSTAASADGGSEEVLMCPEVVLDKDKCMQYEEMLQTAKELPAMLDDESERDEGFIAEEAAAGAAAVEEERGNALMEPQSKLFESFSYEPQEPKPELVQAPTRFFTTAVLTVPDTLKSASFDQEFVSSFLADQPEIDTSLVVAGTLAIEQRQRTPTLALQFASSLVEGGLENVSQMRVAASLSEQIGAVEQAVHILERALGDRKQQ
eukprot:m51a1_g12935 hypothetical protein (316) ;mRNA; f:94-3081